MREKLGYDPSWDEITEYCKKHDIPMMDGTSVFDPVLCELAYRWFNVPEGVILVRRRFRSWDSSRKIRNALSRS